MRDAQPVALLQRGFVLSTMPPAGGGSGALARSAFLRPRSILPESYIEFDM
jgi:hypothetical protein